MTIRVRFAPSPTGFLHIGNARAALINWLFMRHHALRGGEAHFLLRQDDTDLERSKDEYALAIHQDLAWLGITHDDFIKQSDRFDRYNEIKDLLIASGRLYPCYETPEELDFKRKRQMARSEPPLYDRASLSLTQEQIAAYDKEGRRPHWRFRLNPEEISWLDLVRGLTEFHGSRLSDPVLVRADGAFLYTITSVIDDIDFNITHIIRGEDHVTNTAVQIQLFEALWSILKCKPHHLTFAHTSLLLDTDGSPLSKRIGSLSLEKLRQEGFEPMAINSLLARLGTSKPIEPVLTMDELAADFDLSSFSRTPPHFNSTDLENLSHKIYQIMPYSAVEHRLTVLEGIKSGDVSENLWNLVKGNINKLSDIQEWKNVCSGEILPLVNDVEYLSIALELLPPEPWDDQTWLSWTVALKERTGRKGKELFMPLRQALTGFDHGPEMKQLLVMIGYERVRSRLGGK